MKIILTRYVKTLDASESVIAADIVLTAVEERKPPLDRPYHLTSQELADLLISEDAMNPILAREGSALLNDFNLRYPIAPILLEGDPSVFQISVDALGQIKVAQGPVIQTLPPSSQ